MTTATTTAPRVPTTAALLDAWESALTAEPARRALLLLAAMCENCGDLGDRVPGELNRLLLQARALLFGPACDTVADCPGCGARLEAAIPMAELTSADTTPTPVGEITVGDVHITYRSPTWRELTALTDQSVDAAAAQLLAHCVTSISSGERDLTLGELEPEAVCAVDEAISEADPDALIEVQLSCPECGETARLPMDPASFLWDEVDRWALSVLLEVAELAAAFGWSEHRILSMSPWRRRAYVSMAQPQRRPL
jgi:hypothetical protein